MVRCFVCFVVLFFFVFFVSASVSVDAVLVFVFCLLDDCIVPVPQAGLDPLKPTMRTAVSGGEGLELSFDAVVWVWVGCDTILRQKPPGPTPPHRSNMFETPNTKLGKSRLKPLHR